VISRRITAAGDDVAVVADALIAGLGTDPFALVMVFADWRLDPAILATAMARAFAPTPVVGCTTIGVIGERPGTATAVGLRRDAVRVGIGVAPELSTSALARSRDAVQRAVAGLGITVGELDPARHVALTLLDGKCGHEEAFCIGSAAAAARIRVVGGAAATELASDRRAFVWANGEVLADAGLVIALDCAVPFEAVTSCHLVATDVKTVVTAASGRTIDELDGQPAAARLHALVDRLGGTLDDAQPSQYSLARFVDGVPYVRSMTRIEGSQVRIACAVEVGHVLRLMQPGDLIDVTERDLAAVDARIGGISALFAFSCIGRHWEASARGLDAPLARAYAAYPTTGFQTYGEQSGMLLVNHTLTGLAIGGGRG
jgi:hypothetical protein